MTTTVEQFRKWLRHSRRRDRFTYYEGFLLYDRGNPDNKDSRTEEQNEIHILADVVRDTARTGSVTLAQKKLSKGNYRYIAIRL